MIKEYYQVNKKEQIARIEDSMLHHVELNQLQHTTLRMYLNGKVGIAKAEGNYDELELEKIAYQNIKDGPEYLPEPASNQQIEIVYNYMIAKGNDFEADMSDFIRSLKSLFPAFSFHHNIKLIDYHYQLFNNNGVYLSYQDHILDMNLIYEYEKNGEKKTGRFCFRGRRYEKETFIQYLSSILIACQKPYLPPPKDPLSIILSTQDRGFFTHLLALLHGEQYRSNPAAFTAVQSKETFHPMFSFYQSRDPEIHFIPFFDAEAVVQPAFRIPLIQEGKVLTPYTNKEISLQSGLPLTGSSIPIWGQMPNLMLQAFDIKSTHHRIPDILQGKNGLLLQQIHCEDSPDPLYLKARAEQVFLTNGDTILGALPPLTVVVPWKDLFSTCFLGVTTEPIVPFSNQFGLTLQSVPYRW